MSSPSDEPHCCSICKRFVPKMTIEILGTERTVQPKCKCEVDKHLGKVKSASDYETKRRIEQKFSISNLGQRFAECRFDTFIPREGTGKVVKEAKAYVEHFDDIDIEGLLIWGDPGNGKSHLAAAITHEIKAKGKTVVFQTTPELLERIRNTFNRNERESEKDIMDALLHCDLLVLDDIGSERITDWVLDVIFRIVDGRYKQKKPIIYTTNHKPSELKNWLDPKGRIYDRIIETSLVIQNSGTSYRREKAVEAHKMRGGESNG
jgi:DNA replication protein DnaC